VSIDRRKLLEGRLKCRRALSVADLPQSIREKFKQAMDHAEMALLLDDSVGAASPFALPVLSRPAPIPVAREGGKRMLKTRRRSLSRWVIRVWNPHRRARCRR
jgi:hypothetical protein